jgi:hypothetical protein
LGGGQNALDAGGFRREGGGWAGRGSSGIRG